MLDATLRVMLEKLPKRELIETVIGTCKSVCMHDREHYKKLVESIVTAIQIDQIRYAKDDLKGYSLKRQKELFKQLLIAEGALEKGKNSNISAIFEDWQKSGKTFRQWYHQNPWFVDQT